MMSIGNLNFDQISEIDLFELINVGVPQGLYIDYKQDLYGPSEGDAAGLRCLMERSGLLGLFEF